MRKLLRVTWNFVERKNLSFRSLLEEFFSKSDLSKLRYHLSRKIILYYKTKTWGVFHYGGNHTRPDVTILLVPHTIKSTLSIEVACESAKILVALEYQQKLSLNTRNYQDWQTPLQPLSRCYHKPGITFCQTNFHKFSRNGTWRNGFRVLFADWVCTWVVGRMFSRWSDLHTDAQFVLNILWPFSPMNIRLATVCDVLKLHTKRNQYSTVSAVCHNL